MSKHPNHSPELLKSWPELFFHVFLMKCVTKFCDGENKGRGEHLTLLEQIFCTFSPSYQLLDVKLVMSTSLWILPFRKVTPGFQYNVFLSNLFITFVCERAGFGVFSHDFDRFCQIYQQNISWMMPKNLPSIWRSKWWVSTGMENIGGQLLATQHRGCILMASFSISLHLLSDIGTWITFTIFHHLWIQVFQKA